MARPERFELPTPGFVGRCSIQLSYGRVVADGAAVGGTLRDDQRHSNAAGAHTAGSAAMRTRPLKAGKITIFSPRSGRRCGRREPTFSAGGPSPLSLAGRTH